MGDEWGSADNPTLAQHLADPDPNAWWRLDSGSHLNLFEEACDQRDEAEAVVRLLVETGGMCWAERKGGGRCTWRFDHPGAHRAGPYEWLDNAIHTPSPFEPYRAALERITSGERSDG